MVYDVADNNYAILLSFMTGLPMKHSKGTLDIHYKQHLLQFIRKPINNDEIAYSTIFC